jgi:hypothetical protein
MLRRLAVTFALLLFAFSGCVSPRRGPTNSGGSGTGQLYVTNDSGNSILRFSGATAVNGNASPAATISGSNTQLSAPKHIFLDVPNNRLFVGNSGASNILVFDSVNTLNANIAPNRIISSTSLATPIDVAVDTSSRNLLYVVDSLAVVVFANASTANGTTSALRLLQPGFTASAIQLDATNDRLFLADGAANAIDVYDNASTLVGPITATRTLTGSHTQLSLPDGLRIDGAGRLIVSNSSPPSITIYANAASTTGDISPTGVIAGSNTKLTAPAQLALDPTTNSGELYVADPSGGNIPVFNNISGVSGTTNPVPNRNITGPSTKLANTGSPTARGIALDTTR